MTTGMHEVWRLPRVLDLAAAEDFLSTMHERVRDGGSLLLDASDVETLTLPCIQIVLAANASHAVAVVNPSNAFASAFDDLALTCPVAEDTRGETDLVAVVPDEPTPVAAVVEEPLPAEAALEASVAEPSHEEAFVVEVPTDVPTIAAVVAEPLPAEAVEPSVAEASHEETVVSEAADTEPTIANPAELAVAEAVATDAMVAEPACVADAAIVAPETAEAPAAAEGPGAPTSFHQPDPTDESSMAKRVLTIDDSKTMRDMLLLTLEEAGFQVLQAVDGQDGLDVLGKERVDVVITDINMPKMDGYDVIRNLRRNPVHKTLPILVLTTESDTDKKAVAREAGATGWMVKPFDPDRLIATIRKVAP